MRCVLSLLMLTLIVACGDESSSDDYDYDYDSDRDSSGSSMSLSSIERELVGVWTRYHAYDETWDYAVYNADRSGCEFTLDGYSRTDFTRYSAWSLRLVSGTTYLIKKGADATDVFEAAEDTIYQGGYDSLAMRKNGSRGCD